MEPKDTDAHIDFVSRFLSHPCQMDILTHVQRAEDCGSVAACISGYPDAPSQILAMTTRYFRSELASIYAQDAVEHKDLNVSVLLPAGKPPPNLQALEAERGGQTRPIKMPRLSPLPPHLPPLTTR